MSRYSLSYTTATGFSRFDLYITIIMPPETILQDFLPDRDLYNAFAGHFDFSPASTPRFWQAVWTFLFVELFDSL